MSERLREFVRLADQILANPVTRDGIKTTLAWTRTDTDGRGPWALEGPNEYLFRALLLDVRNVRSGDLALAIVTKDLRVLVPDPELDAALDDCLVRLAQLEGQGTVVENGRPIRPASMFRLWAYSEYHHRDLRHIRRLRALEPIQRMVYRMEFVLYVSSLVAEVAFLRHAIDVARARGYLADLEVPVPPADIGTDAGRAAAAPNLVAQRGLMLLVHRHGGRIDFTAADIDRELALYGGPSQARLLVHAEGVGEDLSQGSLELRGPDEV